jgi:virginiamycin B lyase
MRSAALTWACICGCFVGIVRGQSVTEFAIPCLPPCEDLTGYPAGITAGPDGNLWFTESGGVANPIFVFLTAVGQITTGGVITQYPITTHVTGPHTSHSLPGIAAGADGSLWFTEADDNQIGRIATASVITEFAVPTSNSYPQGIAAGPDGSLWFTEAQANQIGRITTAGVITEFALPTSNSYPLGITTGADGNLWFTEPHANQIGRITTAGVISEFAVPTANSSPQAIVAGPDSNLWFSEVASNRIGRMTTGGVVMDFAVPTPNSGLQGIAVGPDGNLWFTESQANRIGRVTTAGVFAEFDIPTSGSYPQGIAPGPDGNLWFTESVAHQIARITVPGSGVCIPDSHTLCLQNGRFFVGATFQTRTGPPASAVAGRLTNDTGYFWFFDPANIEVVTKVLNGCSANGRFWFFAGGLTNVEVRLTVTDSQTGATNTYLNSLGIAFQPVQDTSAFATCP